MEASAPFAGTLPRRVELAGCTNLRDIGGYRGDGGRRVRFGQVFRAASLGSLTDDDLPCIGALGLRTIVDLRGVEESGRAPSRLPQPAPEIVALPVEPTVGASLRDILATGQATGEDVLTLLGRAYAAYATEKLPRFRALLELVAEPARRPVLFHCSAGKDRTGFGTAILLLALGVEREEVMEDYLATNRFWRREHALPEGTPPEVAEALNRAHRHLLEAALERAMAGYPTPQAFFAGAMGFGRDRLAALRDSLLE
ncbi:tyrosine-protein phosphatase [Roseomonas sp. SSH11]|uniref:Tyrosine-protein phosphatase n=1 Tax=Pararoseomonas baculiformis TaxID=2820812 RepID=A0ABS4A9Y1_9PROT|nr:tyrosine-protein phosphatase [Pararoseomonas baculiformis]MBP0443803.1 tyrosine-protein phosphatase [Pararoseomonas baculiformis]